MPNAKRRIFTTIPPEKGPILACQFTKKHVKIMTQYIASATWSRSAAASIASLLTLLITAQSCKEPESPTPTTTTATVSIVGTWNLINAAVVVGSKTFIITRENIIKGGYLSPDDVVFSTDGNYTQGKITGKYTVSGQQLTIGSKTMEVFTLDNTSLQIGNGYPYLKAATTAQKDAIELDALFTAQKLLDTINEVYAPPATANYQFNYRRK
jgi:hypothetical protein